MNILYIVDDIDESDESFEQINTNNTITIKEIQKTGISSSKNWFAIETYQ
jgi:hypothetical protein